jgi:hypothetical protein
MKEHVKVPDLTVMSDSSGNTPLHLVSSVEDGAAIAKLLLSVTAEGWLPIPVGVVQHQILIVPAVFVFA